MQDETAPAACCSPLGSQQQQQQQQSVQVVASSSSASTGIVADVFSQAGAGGLQLRSSQSTGSSSNSHNSQAPPLRILGRNINGTVVQTSMPQNEAELQLYRVMQRASLLSYYDTLLEMGGDDVQQLCDAGEEEFLEIMALVGMASKPLHVRRLQKALQEWLTNPAMFQTPVVPTNSTTSSSAVGVLPGSQVAKVQQQQQQQQQPSPAPYPSSSLPTSPIPPLSPSPQQQQPAYAPVAAMLSQQQDTPVSSDGAALLPLARSPGLVQLGSYESNSCGSQATTPSPSPASPTPPGGLTSAASGGAPILLESQVHRLAEAAERLAQNIRPLNPKPPSGIKKKMCKNLEMVMAMPETDPRRMEEIRKYAAIYGRFDCKRKPEKPLTLHEVSVNEAAAQICRFVPALLTRRDELFPLARRVVRDAGHFFSKALLHSSSNTSPRSYSTRDNGEADLSGGDDSMEAAVKRRKFVVDDEPTDKDHASDQHQQQQQQQQQHQGDHNNAFGIRCSSFARDHGMSIDSDSNSAAAAPNMMRNHRHRKRHRRRQRPPAAPTAYHLAHHKSISSSVWQACADNTNSLVLEGVVEGFDDSDGCYSSFDDMDDDDDDGWDDCNGDDCDDHFPVVDSDDDVADNSRLDSVVAAPSIHDSQHRIQMEQDDVGCMVDKENDFNLKVIASCGDNIIAVANPALMNHNQSPTIKKEHPIKEEICLRDRRD
ncbi:NGFI-A-binding protein homolog [Trichogramma pretiosum]|uniref:NGFI-A-binding protein homolog n=1 Tax=Trichogramma pretiosum TaxID=7493 RepID=UPI0006C97318|nr:NGFI-A-binding protein homolog [Trichogramma pretiosum]